jgi:O-methyltransferase involved in polyketide biosynthesis
VLDAAGVSVPDGVQFVPADLATVSLIDRLVEAGFERERPAFLSWLGVTMYLERLAIDRTLHAAAGLAAGSELVFDYALPPSQRDAAGAEYAMLAESVGAANGEPWVTSLGVDEVGTLLARAGLEVVGQPLLREWVDASLWQRTDAIRPTRLWAAAHARVPGA